MWFIVLLEFLVHIYLFSHVQSSYVEVADEG